MRMQTVCQTRPITFQLLIFRRLQFTKFIAMTTNQNELIFQHGILPQLCDIHTHIRTYLYVCMYS